MLEAAVVEAESVVLGAASVDEVPSECGGIAAQPLHCVESLSADETFIKKILQPLRLLKMIYK